MKKIAKTFTVSVTQMCQEAYVEYILKKRNTTKPHFSSSKLFSLQLTNNVKAWTKLININNMNKQHPAALPALHDD